MTVKFNTDNLRGVTSLSGLVDHAELTKVEVKLVTYDGDTYPEGTIPLMVGRSSAVPLEDVQKFKRMAQETWGPTVHIQIGSKNRRPTLFVYER